MFHRGFREPRNKPALSQLTRHQHSNIRVRRGQEDAALINAAQAAEHYEIVRYGSLIAWARQLGRNDCAAILQTTLDEEKITDKKLTSIAEGRVNLRAAG